MAKETASWVTQLDTANPVVGDPVGEGDDHLRMLKTVLKNSFPSTSTTAIVPDVSGESGKFLTNDGTDTSWGTAGSSTPVDNTFRIQDNSDATKQIAFEASGITTGTTRTITMPDSDVTLLSSGAIVNADINASAAIAQSKLATLAIDTAELADDAVTAAKIASGVLENPNVVINGGFDVWQRGVTFSSLSYYQDYADRWMGDAYNSAGNTISRQSGTASEPFYYFLRFQRDSGQTVTGARRVGTVFESQDTRFMCGQEVTLSWYMRKGANWSPATDTVTSYIFTGTGSNESMSNGLGSAWTGFAQQTQSNTITTSWVRFTHTVTLSATAMQVGINFVTPASVGTAGAADSWDMGGVKLELGGVATPFMNKGFGPEMARCQRYFSKTYDADTAPGAATDSGAMTGLAVYSSGSQGLGARWPTAMRTTPVVVLYSTDGTSGQVRQTSNNVNIATTAGSPGANGFQYVSGSLPNTYPNGWRFHYTADAEL